MSAGNLWAQFRRVAETPTPQFLAEVVTVEEGDFSVVSLLPSGTLLKVKRKQSDVNQIGDRVIVQDGAIVENGPAGTVQNATI